MGLWFTGVVPRLLGMHHTEPPADAGQPLVPVYVDLPEMVANLNSNPRRPSYLKLVARLEVTKQTDVPLVTAAMPPRAAHCSAAC